jgi:hypothetical protein
MPVCGSGVLVCSSCLLIRRAQRARCQAETPPILLFRFPEPALKHSFLLQLNSSHIKKFRKFIYNTLLVLGRNIRLGAASVAAHASVA